MGDKEKIRGDFGQLLWPRLLSLHSRRWQVLDRVPKKAQAPKRVRPRGKGFQPQDPKDRSCCQVPVEGVKGRFDHFASGKGRVFVSALGDNTIEVINIFGGIVKCPSNSVIR
jgi:hypothetical protein